MHIQQLDDSQWHVLKNIGRRFGKAITIILLVCVGSMVAWQYRGHHQAVQAEQASSIFELMLKAMRNQDETTAQAQAQILKSRFDHTPYAELSALMLARLAVDANNLSTAESELTWVINQKKPGPSFHIARVRLAKVFMAENKMNEALDLLKWAEPNDYQALYLDAKGDYHLARNELEEARAAYQKALEVVPAQTPMPWLTLKLNDLGKKEAS